MDSNEKEEKPDYSLNEHPVSRTQFITETLIWIIGGGVIALMIAEAIIKSGVLE